MGQPQCYENQTSHPRSPNRGAAPGDERPYAVRHNQPPGSVWILAVGRRRGGGRAKTGAQDSRNPLVLPIIPARSIDTDKKNSLMQKQSPIAGSPWYYFLCSECFLSFHFSRCNWKHHPPRFLSSPIDGAVSSLVGDTSLRASPSWDHEPK